VERTAQPGAEDWLREGAGMPADLQPHQAPGHLQEGGHPMISPKPRMLYFKAAATRYC